MSKAVVIRKPHQPAVAIICYTKKVEPTDYELRQKALKATAIAHMNDSEPEVAEEAR